MSDFFGRLVSVFVAVIAIVFIPIIAMAVRTENTKRSMIETYATEFVDNARATGKITAEEYESTYSNILRCQNNCSFTITHSSRMYANNEGESVFFYADFNTQDILDVIYKSSATENVPYELRNGDYITVTIKNEQPTFATKLYRIFMRAGDNNTSIYVNYGGLVGNYIEETE